MDKSADKTLSTSALLGAFLDLSNKWALTADIALKADDVALFQLLPLIMAHIQRASLLHDDRNSLVHLLHVLRVRLASCRWLKLRFLLLAHHPAFSSYWTYVPVHRSHAYTVARHVVKQLVADTQLSANNNINCVPARKEKEVNGVAALLSDVSALLYFAEHSLFHPTKGIHCRTILHHKVVVRSGFNGKQLVDTIIAKVKDNDRDHAAAVAQKLLDMGIIHPVAARTPYFNDSYRAVYQCRRTTLRDGIDRRFRILSADGVDLTSRDSSPDSSGRLPYHGVRRVEFRIPMDMVDLQSVDFWTKAIFIKKAKKGYHYDFRAVVHPFYSVSLAQGLPELKVMNGDDEISVDDNFEFNAEEESSGDSSASDCISASSPVVSHPTVKDQGSSDLMQQTATISSVVILKVFSSIAHPMIVELRKPLEDGILTCDEQFVSLPPHIFVKSGDNLMQDLGVQLMFRFFNHIWNTSPYCQQRYSKQPYCVTYDVMPTSASDGLMEAVTGLTSLKDFEWKAWANKFGTDEDIVNDMLRSSVGSYIGTYILGGRDRHFDNIVIQDNRFLLHIDFSYVLGRKPPIDGPPISIAPDMEETFRQLNIWDRFVSMCIAAFVALREQLDALVRNTVTLFEKAGYREEEMCVFLEGEGSLNRRANENEAVLRLRRQIEKSSGDIGNWFKEFTHERVVPVWYRLVKRGFPPAKILTRLRNAHEEREAIKLAESLDDKSPINDEERVEIS